MSQGISLTDKIMSCATKHLTEVVEAAKLGESHSLAHMLAVTENLKKALDSNSKSENGLKIT